MSFARTKVAFSVLAPPFVRVASLAKSSASSILNVPLAPLENVSIDAIALTCSSVYVYGLEIKPSYSGLISTAVSSIKPLFPALTKVSGITNACLSNKEIPLYSDDKYNLVISLIKALASLWIAFIDCAP